MSRLLKSAPGEYYHVFNRGAFKNNIFHNDSDRSRFLFLVMFFQSDFRIQNYTRLLSEFSNNLSNDVLDKDLQKSIFKERSVELISFCLMPNHFHILIKEVKENGIANYMHRILTAYTKYYNLKYNKTGHLFSGPYKSVHIEDDLQLMHCSAYIHSNPLEIGKNMTNLDQYLWSSYFDYIFHNRWSMFLERLIILDRFKDEKKFTYKDFVETSPAKKQYKFL